ncbi:MULTISPECIES: DUF317 domain-containing protein [unclassified Streptomyces]|uniref:DUF317 domain-containing protein n=1 Tax=unclassified Streptomyces TaxID=2593676 RepID=UPI002366F6F4|nr:MULTISPECIES: DUF317 domain-containing protein [unclassified Streptomyces]MDF3140889.1 DUF317 domain-containing protein [Streptomyces sp. T21Q-yed]WDF43507.1 DUF317 domain-containing protein [Streptomyces sp. T12]
MPLSERQLAAFADTHATQIPFDTSPRHLAGPGDARHVTHGLAAAGWSAVSDPLSPEIVLRSPDLRHRLQFDPQSTTSAWWRLRAEPADTQPGWYAEFGELVPAEVLAGLTDALVAGAPAEPTSPLSVLEAAGWLIDGRGIAYSDPPGCRVERLPGNGSGTVPWREQVSVTWHIDVRDRLDGVSSGTHLWHAAFSSHTPEHLVTAFVAALTDPAPVQRGMFDRTARYGVMQRSSPFTPQHTVDAHTTRIKALRAQARAARRQQTKPATTPANASTAQPAAHR